MGAWGLGSFDNDDAIDWVGDLTARGLRAVTDAFEAVTAAEGEYLEAPEASVALAAAELVAAATGRPGPPLPDGVTAWINGHTTPPGASLRQQAAAAAERVLEDSELRELWEEGEDFAEWEAGVRDLLGRLR